METTKCPKCKHPLPTGDDLVLVYCSNCGHKLEKEKEDSPKKKGKFVNVLRKKFPSFSDSMDNAANNMFGE